MGVVDNVSGFMQAMTQYLAKAGVPEPRLDVEMLLAQALGVSRAHLLAHQQRVLSESEQEQLTELIEQRAEGVPLSYVLGKKDFWTFSLQVNPSVLVPRPDTECLVEAVLDRFITQKKMCVADLGTGSGAIAIALAISQPDWEVWATDVCEKALEVAQHNAWRILAGGRVSFRQGSWYEALPKGKKFDVLVSNPPYVALNDPCRQADGVCAEPALALFAEEEGLACLKHLIQHARTHLVSGGMLFLEHGATQAEAVREIFLGSGFLNPTTVLDLGGCSRVTFAACSLG